MGRTTLTYELPARFFEDHESRGLFNGRVDRRTKSTVTVAMTVLGFDEMLSDARFYSTEWRHMGPEYMGLGSSARATVRRLEAVGRPEEVPTGTPGPEGLARMFRMGS